MKAIKVIKDPNAFRILADETRRRIVYLLRAKERTVAQIADELDLTPQAIYHHIRKLKDADMVEVAREERVEHFIETYYRATAEVFNLSHGEGSGKENKNRIREAIDALPKIGFEMKADEGLPAKVAAIEKRLKGIGFKSEIADKSGALDDVDFFVKQSLTEYAMLLSMTDDDYEEYDKLERELRKLLRSAVVPKPRAKKKA
ncbi:MAG: hypothetical protein A3K75_06345 [Euryarchaeota archaeon RBG_13_61_15]|nr:MAG: hypothetical protein A3K75_06345 [Euryarchaeota archaeon RBG_13_61_15]